LHREASHITRIEATRRSDVDSTVVSVPEMSPESVPEFDVETVRRIMWRCSRRSSVVPTPSSRSSTSGRPRDGSRSVPEEILSFFDSHQGQTLLVRGEPGAGKTLFAARLLDALHQTSRDVLYASTRLNHETVVDDYFDAGAPGLDESHVVDLSSDADGGLGLDRELELERTTLDGLLDWLETLGEVGEELSVVFDSWDLIGDAVDHPGVESIEDRLATFAREHRIDLTFVSEAATPPEMEYVMDGSVTLTTAHDARGRPERRLRLDKLRGVRIGNRTHPYTLANGQFSSFGPTDVAAFWNVDDEQLWEPVDNTKRRFSAGVPALDDLLDGGYRRGSVVQFDLGTRLPRDAWGLLTVPLARNFLADRRGTIVVPPADASPGLLRRELDLVLPGDRVDDYCDVVRPNPAITVPTGRRSASDDEQTDEPPDPTAGYFDRAERLRERSDGPLLHVIGTETADDLDVPLTTLADYVAVHNDLAVIVTKPAGNQRAAVERVTDAHLVLTRRSETLFLRGETPLTPLLGIDITRRTAIPRLRLTEAV
jgi:KaiC/GvpD/RAD55 family RecA-like ATPase